MDSGIEICLLLLLLLIIVIVIINNFNSVSVHDVVFDGATDQPTMFLRL